MSVDTIDPVLLDTKDPDRCLPVRHRHLGKYSDCLTEALHEQVSATHGWADEEGGTVDCPTGYFWLIKTEPTASVIIEADEWSGRVKLIIGPGVNCLIRTNDQGAVWSEWFDDSQAAQAAYDALDQAYGIWSEANDY